MKSRYGSRTWKETEIASQVKWIRERGDTLDGYIDRYGSANDPDHYGNGGEVIYVADMCALAKLSRTAPMEYFGIEAEKLRKAESLMLEMSAGAAGDWRLESITELFGHSKPLSIEGEGTFDIDATVREVSERHGLGEQAAKLLPEESYPVIAGADRFGPFLMFGSFRSAMPSRVVADKIVQVLAESDYYPTPTDISDEMQSRYSKGR